MSVTSRPAFFIMEQITELKTKYGRIFKVITPVTKITIYFRLISKLEYDRYINMAPFREIVNTQAEDYLLSQAVVSHGFAQLEALLLTGEFHSVAEAIAINSGFHNIEDFTIELKRRRLAAQILIEQIIAFISKAFPIYKVSEIEAMTYDEIARLLALSENMMGQRLQIPGAEIEEPQEPTKGVLKRGPNVAEMSDKEKAVINRNRKEALEVLQKSKRQRQS